MLGQCEKKRKKKTDIRDMAVGDLCGLTATVLKSHAATIQNMSIVIAKTIVTAPTSAPHNKIEMLKTAHKV